MELVLQSIQQLWVICQKITSSSSTDRSSVPNMFSMVNSKPHSIRKRMISNVYSKSYLQSSPEFHQISKTMIFSRLLPVLEEASIKRQPLDVLELNFSSTMDFIIAFIFGLQNSTNFLQDIPSRKHWLSIYQSRRPYRFWAGELPGVVSFFKKLGIHVVPAWVADASRELEAWTLDKCTAAASSISPESKEASDPIRPSSTATEPIVYTQLHTPLALSTPPPPSPYLLPLLIATELHDHLAAGHETSGITLTYLMHELSLHPSIQSALRTELRSLSPPLTYPPHSPTHDLPSPRDIDALPLLHACLTETLRLHAAIPGPQPRITPSTPTSLAGSPPLPGGVRVSAQAYTLHRNAAVFPEPEVWKPERWLNAGEEKEREMGRWFWTFGSGGRMCVGRHFAVQGTLPESPFLCSSFFALGG